MQLASGWNQWKKRWGAVRNVVREATSSGSSRDHKPVPSERKSGIPEGVEIPAPVNTTARSALRSSTAASSIAARFAKLIEASAGLADSVISEAPLFR